MSYFSSLGPTLDGRMKPDVLAPGFKILSALSGDSSTAKDCGVTEIQGEDGSDVSDGEDGSDVSDGEDGSDISDGSDGSDGGNV